MHSPVPRAGVPETDGDEDWRKLPPDVSERLRDPLIGLHLARERPRSPTLDSDVVGADDVGIAASGRETGM